SIPDDLRDWALQQSVFFVASAPLRGRHVNLSPKGLPDSSVAILTPNQIAYIDSTGSGCETISHVRENGRLTLIFCSFDASPRIVRLFCTGTVLEWDQPAFLACLEHMKKRDVVGARAIIKLDVFKVQTSCGFGVPLLALSIDPESNKSTPFLKNRDTLNNVSVKKFGEQREMQRYQQEMNIRSLDGLPALRSALKDSGHHTWRLELKDWFPRHRDKIEKLKSVALALLVGLIALLLSNRT
ncbi:hypothetical protein N7540_011850, partial [Penicillium herquei]